MTFAGKDDRIEKLKCACGGMADTIDLGSIFERSAGSSPVRRTKAKKPPAGFFVLVRMIGLSLCTPGRMRSEAKHSSETKCAQADFVLCRCSSPVTLQVRCHRRTRICITQRPRQPTTVVGGDFFVSENHDKSKKCARKCANPIVNIAISCYTGVCKKRW